MPILADLATPAIPISPDCSAADLAARLLREPDTSVVPVVHGDRLIGLVERRAFLAAALDRLSDSGGPLAVTPWVDGDPLVGDAHEDVGEFVARSLAGGAALLGGFAVLDQGRYVGVGDALTLLRAQAPPVFQPTSSPPTPFPESLAREIGAPLRGLLGLTELMQRQPLSLDGSAYLRTMIASTRALIGLVTDAVAWAPGAEGEVSLRPEPVSPQDLVDQVDAVWRGQADIRRIRLITACRADPELRIKADAARLKQVLDTLIGHALDASEGGVVEAQLRAEPLDDRVHLEFRVRDTRPSWAAQASGAGDDAEAAVATFGMTMASRIVRAMGGRLFTEHNHGEGATVGFTVNLDRVEAPVDAAESDGFEAGLGHILIVDDNATNRLVAEALCEGFGFTTETAEDGAEAVEAARLRAFDVVLMDIRMPRMDGVEATRAIRALGGASGAVPIIALTANADPDDVVAYRRAGMAGLVDKPIKPDSLYAAIAAVLFPDATPRRTDAAA